MTSTHRIGSLQVPALALGTMYFGTTLAAKTSADCLDAADEVGARFWDTANNYAFWAGGQGDEAESVIGDWFAARGTAARDRIVLATKVGARPLAGYSDLEHIEGLTAPAVRAQVQGSLKRLRTDRIDLLYSHIDDRSVPFEETLGVLSDLVTDGTVREVAASNLTATRLEEALAVDSPHPYGALQQRFTYLTTDPSVDTGPQVVLDAETERVARAAGVALVGYSPLLSGAYTRPDRPLPDEYRRDGAEGQVAMLQEKAAALDLDAGQLVLAWMGQRAVPVIPIVGVSRVEQVHAAWEAANTALPPNVLTAREDDRT